MLIKQMVALVMMLSVSLISFLTLSQTARAEVTSIELFDNNERVKELDVSEYDTTEELVKAIVKAIEETNNNDDDSEDSDSSNSNGGDNSNNDITEFTAANNDNIVSTNQNSEADQASFIQDSFTCSDNSIVQNEAEQCSAPVKDIQTMEENQLTQPPTAAVTTGGAAAAATTIPFPSVPALPTIPEDLTVEPEEEGDVNDPSEVVDQEIEDQKEDNKEEAVDTNEKME